MESDVLVEQKSFRQQKETEVCSFELPAGRFSVDLQHKDQFLQKILRIGYARQYIPGRVGLCPVNLQARCGRLLGYDTGGLFQVHCSEDSYTRKVADETW